jgi:acyl dehydratase
MYYEDFQPGARLKTPSRTVTAEDLSAFIDLSGLDNPLFTSDAAARERGHEKRLVPAPLQLSIAMGLCQKAGFFDRVVAVVEFKRLKLHRPVHPGDELTLTAEVLEAKPTSKPQRGLVVLAYDLANQDQATVLSAQAVYLMGRRHA